MHFYVLQARVVNGELKVQAFHKMHVILILHRKVARRLGKGGKMRLTIRLLFHYYHKNVPMTLSEMFNALIRDN